MDEFNTRKPMMFRKRGIYLLPNLFTTGALFAGFFAIVQTMNNKFEVAAVAIFIAMVLDGLDGRVARLTHTQSEFGAEYDSLSDMVSFGVAPSLVVYEWALKGLGKWGWFAAFIYCCATALRLARFNTNIDVVDKRYFQGLPSPAAAALVAGFVWVMLDYGISSLDIVEIVSGSMRELQLRVPRTRLANLKNIDELVDVFVGVMSGGGDAASPLERAADSRG